ncbi:MAG: FAD-binding oxidoreductase [Alphaproteobacteria bacterium]|nr:FAD-binding oxidoreductase [Alphaproteobacteria bacterium]
MTGPNNAIGCATSDGKLADVAVLGAGMLGVSSALELVRRGKTVVLIDKSAPGEETSYGNAGVIYRGSMMPLNTPQLLRALPGLLKNKSNGLRYNPAHIARHPGRFLRFLWEARESSTLRRSKALGSLLDRSIERHLALSKEAGEADRIRHLGWLKLYRTEKSFHGSAWERKVFRESGLKISVLDPAEIADLEPGLKPIYHRGVLFDETWIADDPGMVTKAYADTFTGLGGRLVQQPVGGLRREGDRWRILGEDGVIAEAAAVVLALGPWSDRFLATLGLTLPMIHERGAHREFVIEGEPPVSRSITDIDGGFAFTPMRGRMRLTCGVRIDSHKAPPSTVQLDLVEAAVKQAVDLGPRTNKADWHGARPTLPDCIPAIGRLPLPDLWLATGNQHMGFASGPASGELLADLLTGRKPAIDPAPFDPARFRLS